MRAPDASAEEPVTPGVTGPAPDIGGVPTDLAGWPGADRRSPGLAHGARLTLRPLARAMARAVAREVAPAGRRQAVLDIGCGEKPYLPFFADVADRYVGVDTCPGPQVDVVAAAESLPFASSSFDVVVSAQTLEHVSDPPKVIREAHRVLKPGGVLLLSTHGTAFWHPMPDDFWRWTQQGLVKLLRDNGDWSRIDLEAAGGTMACFGYLFGMYAAGALRGPLLAPVRYPLLALNNATFAALDRVVPLRYPRPFTLISNFLAVGRARGTATMPDSQAAGQTA